MGDYVKDVNGEARSRSGYVPLRSKPERGMRVKVRNGARTIYGTVDDVSATGVAWAEDGGFLGQFGADEFFILVDDTERPREHTPEWVPLTKEQVTLLPARTVVRVEDDAVYVRPEDVPDYRQIARAFLSVLREGQA